MLLIAIPALGSCIGIGLIAIELLQASARQPERMPTLQTTFFLVLGVTGGVFITATRTALWLATSNRFR